MGAPRLGIIGLGAISRFYLRAARRMPSFDLVAVCDRDPGALAPWRGSVRCYTDHRSMLRRAGLDAVVVTVPNDLHAAVCRDVLRAGLPVCVEKPLATRVTDGEALVREARRRGRALFTAFHRRYNRSVLALADRLPPDVPVASMTVRYLERIEEHIGRDAWYLDPERCGGGCVADNGPNAYDLVRLFIGEVAVGEADVVRDGHGVDRSARVRLDSADGARAEVHLDWSHPGERKDLRVRLADGRTDSADMLNGFSGFKESLWHEYTAVLTDFRRALDGAGGASDAAAANSQAALELVEATYRAEGSGADQRAGP